MSLQSLDNLVKIGQLKIEARNQLEFIGLLRSGQARLNDGMNSTLADERLLIDLILSVQSVLRHVITLQQNLKAT